MWPTINIDSCVLIQIRINHWEASVSLVVWYFLVLTPLSCLCFVLVSESSGQRKLGMQISAWNPGEEGAQCLFCSRQADSTDAPGGAEGGPAETHLCHFLHCLLADCYLKGDAIGCWAFTPSNSEHATSSFILQWFSSLWKVWSFVFLLYPFFLC